MADEDLIHVDRRTPGSDSGEAVGILEADVVCSATAHRKTGQVDAVGVDVEAGDGPIDRVEDILLSRPDVWIHRIV